MKNYKYILQLVSIFAIALILNSCLPGVTEEHHNIAGEPQVTKDCPQGNNFTVLINGNKPASEAKDFHLQISRIETEDLPNNRIKVKVYAHPIDISNNFMTGLTKESFHKLLDSNDKTYKSSKISNFSVKEVNSNQDEPVALALVLDHSGSMGDRRAKQVQGAVYGFLRNSVKKKDSILIVKFDNKAQLEPLPNLDVNDLTAIYQQEKYKTGLEGYGNTTALLDATGLAVQSLSKLNGFSQKAVIVFTDGVENSSKTFVKPEQVVTAARDSKVTVHTVAFGDYVDKGMLADMLAAPTSGSYSYICTSDEFNLVYDYIYSRIKNYYVLEYETEKNPGVNFVNLSLNHNNHTSIAENTYLVSAPPQIIDVNFDSGKSNLKTSNTKKTKDNEAAVQKIYDFMLKDTAMTISINGYTDSVGVEALNDTLSFNRANAVKNALISKGITVNRMFVKGMGEKFPIDDNGTEQGRAKNRRVEFVVLTITDKKVFRTAEASMIR